MWFLLIPALFLLFYYWIAKDEMKGQHPVRRAVWLMLVPLCGITSLFFLVFNPFLWVIDMFVMMFFIALGEGFDKPKHPEQELPWQITLLGLVIVLGICFILMLF